MTDYDFNSFFIFYVFHNFPEEIFMYNTIESFLWKNNL